MSELQTDKLKNLDSLSMREYRMIAKRCKCSTELVRRILLNAHGFTSRKEKKILKGAKIIIANRKKLDLQLDKALTEEEILDAQLTGNQYS